MIMTQQKLKTLWTITKRAEEVLEGYTFKLTAILDDNDRCIPNKNRMALHQLDRALMRLGEED